MILIFTKFYTGTNLKTEIIEDKKNNIITILMYLLPLYIFISTDIIYFTYIKKN